MLTPSRAERNNPEHLSNSRVYNTKCVCEICTCGKHRCPQKQTKFDAETTHHQDYKPYNITAQKVGKAEQNIKQRHYDPELLKSSYGTAYVPHDIKREQHQARCEYRPSKAQFYDETEYKKSFVPNEIKVQKPTSAIQYIPNKAKFNGTTTYNAEYSPKKIAPEVLPEHVYQQKKIPFEGKTVYETEYKSHKIEATRPQSSQLIRYEPNKAKFQGQSRYKQCYQPHEMEKPQICPVNVLPSYPRRCSPGKSHVNFMAETNKWE